MMPAPNDKFEPDNTFFSMLGVAFAVMITVATAMVMILPAVHVSDAAAAASRPAVTKVATDK